jgi:protein ImuA
VKPAAHRQPDPGLQLPDVWRVDELAASRQAIVGSGHAALDAQLPGGGWPVGSLVEILPERPEQHAWQLLLPGLAAACRLQAGPLVLVGAPFVPFGASLAAQGLAVDRLLCVQAERPAARLWAAEQALRCADVVGVLAWLPQAKAAELRRLQLAAQQHDKLLFAFRLPRSQGESSPARLRLLVEGTESLQVRILKRRGPPLTDPLALPAQPARLAALLAARRGRAQPAALQPQPPRTVHGLDRTPTLA